MENKEDRIILESMVSIYILKNLQEAIDDGYIIISEDVAIILFDYEKYLVKIFGITHDTGTKIIHETLNSVGIQSFILNYATKEITSDSIKNNVEPVIVLLKKLQMISHDSKMTAVSNRDYLTAAKYRDIELSILKAIAKIIKKVI